MKADIGKLKNLVESLHGEDAHAKVREALDSLIDRQYYAKYHFDTYRDILTNKDDIRKKMSFVLLVNDSEYRDRIALEANIIACLQSLHTVHDLLAYMIVYTLLIDFDDESRINIYSLKDKVSNSPRYQKLLDLLNELTNHVNFKYLAAASNHSKHRFHIGPQTGLDMRESENLKCTFIPFDYKGVHYPKKEIDKFFNSEYSRESTLIIKIENELISLLETGENQCQPTSA